MRSPDWESGRSVTTALLLLTTAGFFVQCLLKFYTPFNVDQYFGLSFSGLKQGYIWQPLTYQFLHGSLLHLLSNLLVIYLAGRALEDTLTRQDYLRLYFLSGIFGGLLQAGLGGMFPNHFGGLTVGASGAAMGLVAAYSTLFPERVLTVLAFFIFPISMRAKTLLYIALALSLFGVLVPIDNVANAAHLGGLLGGIAYIRWQVQSTFLADLVRSLAPRPSPRPRPRELVGAEARKPLAWSLAKPAAKPSAEAEVPPAEFMSREVDPILDKISAHGLQSLTERERKILEQARARMGKP